MPVCDGLRRLVASVYARKHLATCHWHGADECAAKQCVEECEPACDSLCVGLTPEGSCHALTDVPSRSVIHQSQTANSRRAKLVRASSLANPTARSPA
jgi:hypothetical protein